MKHAISILAIFTLAMGLFSQSASADSAAEIIKEQTEQLNRRLGDLENRCKTKIKASIDVKSFSKVVGLKANEEKVGNLYSHCSKPIRELTDWCANGYDKPVKEQISSYVCRYDDGKRAMSLKQGVLTMTTNWEREKHDWSKNAVGNVLSEGDFSVSQAALIRNDTGRIKSGTGDMKRSCNHSVKWKVDWKSFKGELNKRVGSNNLTQIWQQCAAPLRALELMCDNAQAELMAEQVKSFVCRFDAKADAAANANAGVSLKNKVLSVSSNFAPKGGLQEWANNLVGDALRDGDFSVRQAAFMKSEEADLQRLYSSHADNKCGTKIGWSIDWKSFIGEVDKRLSKQEKTSIYASCGVPLNRLGDVCGSDRKNKVKAKVKSYTCSYGGKKKQKFALKKGKLAFHVDFSAEDSYGSFDAFLVKNKVVKKRPEPKKLSPKDLASIRRVLGGQRNTQQCYKTCARKRGARAKQQCRNSCQ